MEVNVRVAIVAISESICIIYLFIFMIIVICCVFLYFFARIKEGGTDKFANRKVSDTDSMGVLLLARAIH